MANEKRRIDADGFGAYLMGKMGFNPANAEMVLQWMNEYIKQNPTVDTVEVVHGRCDWCKTGEEKCGTCRMFFDYYGDGGSDKCSSECDSGKCAYYQPIGFCPNCGADMRERKDNGTV